MPHKGNYSAKATSKAGGKPKSTSRKKEAVKSKSRPSGSGRSK